MVHPENRRSAFRMDDVLTLEYMPLDSRERTAIESRFVAWRAERLQPRPQLQRPPETSLRAIARTHAAAAQWLRYLDTRIEQIEARLQRPGPTDDQSEESLAPSAGELPVSLSASGVAFPSPDDFAEGTPLEIGLWPRGAPFRISVLAEVVATRPRRSRAGEAGRVAGEPLADGSGEWWIMTRFVRIDPGDEQILMRHVLELQRLMLGPRRAIF